MINERKENIEKRNISITMKREYRGEKYQYNNEKRI
jgi:hypothetical protein|tara:strand:- start:291 stop:398 length:108 start_codon:yes stop_codon:yes gene_type:complete